MYVIIIGLKKLLLSFAKSFANILTQNLVNQEHEDEE